jgi:hypothetical protein
VVGNKEERAQRSRLSNLALCVMRVLVVVGGLLYLNGVRQPGLSRPGKYVDIGPLFFAGNPVSIKHDWMVWAARACALGLAAACAWAWQIQYGFRLRRSR